MGVVARRNLRLSLASKGQSAYRPPILRGFCRVPHSGALLVFLKGATQRPAETTAWPEKNDEKETDFNGYYELYGRIRSTLG
jgi:hypothetical protein